MATNARPEKPLGSVVGWGHYEGKMCLAWLNYSSKAIGHTPVEQAVFGPFADDNDIDGASAYQDGATVFQGGGRA